MHTSEYKKLQETTTSHETNSRVTWKHHRSRSENKAGKNESANKARGSDDLPVEVIKQLKDTGTKWIASFFRKIMSERIPQDWRKSAITPIYKQKGDLLDCGNYRGIKIISYLLKL